MGSFDGLLERTKKNYPDVFSGSSVGSQTVSVTPNTAQHTVAQPVRQTVDFSGLYERAMKSYPEAFSTRKTAGNDLIDRWTRKYQGKGYRSLASTIDTMEDGAEKEWLKSYAQQVDYDEKRNLDIGSYEKEIKALEQKMKDYDPDIDWTNPTDRKKFDAEMEAMQADIDMRKNYLTLAKRIQEQAAGEKKYSQIAKKSDFSAKSGYDSSNQELGYQYVNADASGRLDLDEKYGDYAGQFAERGWDSLDEDEKAIYNYFMNIGDRQNAAEYLKFVEQSAQKRKGLAADAYIDKLAKEDPRANALRYAFMANVGLDQNRSAMEDLGHMIAGNTDYRPISATQYAGQLMREDLGNDGKKHEMLGGVSTGQMVGDIISTTANMAPSILTSTVIGLLNPAAGATAGKLMMSGGAAGSGYREMINEGYSKEQARLYGLGVGAAEYFMESALGGISKLGGAPTKALTKWAENVDNVLFKFALQLGGSGISEGLEEGLTEVVSGWLKSQITHEDFYAEPADVMYSSLLGFATGILFEGPSVASDIGQQSRQGKAFKDAKGVDALKEMGAVSTDSTTRSLADRISNDSGNFAVGKLARKVESEATRQNSADLAKSLTQKGMPEKAAKQYGEMLSYMLEAGSDTDIQRMVMESDPVIGQVLREAQMPGSKVQQRLQNLSAARGKTRSIARVASLYGKQAEAVKQIYNQGQKADGTKQDVETFAYGFQRAFTVGRENGNVSAVTEEIAPGLTQSQRELAYNLGRDAVAAEKAEAAKRTTGEESSVHILNEDGSLGDAVRIAEISSNDRNNVTYVLEDGRTVSEDQLSFSGDNAVLDTVKDLGLDVQTANIVIRGNKTITKADTLVAHGIDDAFRYGSHGYSLERLAKDSPFAALLTEEMRTAVYNAGKNTPAVAEKKPPAVKVKTRGKNAGIYYDAGGGDVTAYRPKQFGKLEHKRESGVYAAQVLQKLGIGVDFYFFRSYVNSKGERVYLDVDGMEQKAPNGWYDKSDGSIHIDLNAGNDGQGLTLFTMAHELTHFIEQWSPEKYKVLADFLIQNYEKGQSMDELVLIKQQALSAGRKKPVSYEEAYSEVIADSMEAMLADGNVMDKLRELKAKDSDLVARMKEFFDRMVKRITKYYQGLQPESEEGQLVLEMKDQFKQIQQLFAEALAEASDNLQAASDNDPAVAGQDMSNEEAFLDSETAVHYQIRPPYADGSKAFNAFVEDLNPEARETFDLFYGFYQRSRITNTVSVSGKKVKAVNISSLYLLAQDWNDMIAKEPKWAAAAKELAGFLPADVRKRMNMNEDGTLIPSTMEKEFKMPSSMAQRLVDALPYESIDARYTMGDKTVTLPEGKARQSVGGEAYRRAIIAETRKLFAEGKLKPVSIGTMSKDRWGSLGFLAANGKTGASGDFTTVCPQMMFNRGCWYCYRRAAMEKGVNNKLVANNVWYTGEILRIKDSDIDALNRNGGLRIQSFGDWMPHFSAMLADVLYDAEQRGLQVKIITKEPSMISYIAALREQGVGKNLYFNLSSDYTIERGPARQAQGGDSLDAVNPERPFMRDQDNSFWWKRAMSVEEAAKYREKYPWVNTRIVATDVEEFIRGLKDSHVDVVTGYHGNIRGIERIDSSTGQRKIEVEALGDAGMPRFAFNPVTGSWVTEYEGKTATHKRLAQAIADNGLQMEYYTKTCCITGRCATCNGKCGALARDFNVKNATNRDAESIAYWQEQMEYAEEPEFGDMTVDSGKRMYSDRKPAEQKAILEDKYYARQIDKWDGKDHGGSFRVGKVSDPLLRIGIPDVDIWFDQSKAAKQLEGKKEIDKDVLKKIPYLLEHPIAISESYDNTVMVFGEMYDENGNPIVVALRVNSTNRRNHITLVNKIRSVGTRTHNLDKLLSDEAILYLNETKKETNRWFNALGRSTPFGGTKFGLIRSISFDVAKSNILQNNSPDNSQVQRQDRSTGTSNRDLLAGAFEQLAQKPDEKEFLEKYRKNIKGLNEQEAKLQKLRQQIREISFGKGPRDTKKLKELQEEATKTANRINTYDKILLNLEATVPLKRVLERERQKVKQKADADKKAAVAKVREETKAAIEGVQSESEIMEREFLRLMRAYEKLSSDSAEKAKKAKKAIDKKQDTIDSYKKDLETMNREFIRVMKGYETAERKTNAFWEGEFKRLMREYEASGRKVDRLEAKLKAQRESIRSNVDSRRRTVLRNKIRKDIRELDKILNKGNKKRNVKQGMQDFVAKAIATGEILFADLDSDTDLIASGIQADMTADERKLLTEAERYVRQIAELEGNEAMADVLEARRRGLDEVLKQLQPVLERERIRINSADASSAFDALVAAYESLQESPDTYIAAAFNPDALEYLRSVKHKFAGTLVKDMTQEQLQELHKCYKMVMTMIRDANKAFVDGRSVQADAEQMVQEFQERKIPAKKVGIILRNLSNAVGWNYEKLYYALERINSPTLKRLYQNLADSENITMQDVQEAKAFQMEMVEKYHYNDWKIDQKMERTFLDNNGKEFHLTLGELMALYAYSRREGADRHIEVGGFTFGKNALTDPAPASTYKLTADQVAAISDLLTPEQKSFAEAMQRYLSKTMGAKGNEVSMKLYGIEMFGEENYFPLHIAGEYKARAQESQAKAEAGFQSMTNAGFTKARNTNATAPIVLESFMEVWVDHVNEMARYHGAVPALEDIRRVMNYSVYSDAMENSVSVKAAMTNAYGKQAVQYFDSLYREANSGAVTDKMDAVSKSLLSAFRKNSVAYSGSVVIQQPASIYRAMAIVDPKYFGKHGLFTLTSGVLRVFNKAKWNAAYADMMKYAPGVTMAKEIGGFDTSTGGSIRSYLLDTDRGFKQSMKNGTAAQKAGAVLDVVDDNVIANLPNVADKIAWIEIWEACRRETVANNPKLATGSEAFKQKVGQRFTEVIRATQVYDSMFSKSPMLKSKNLAVQYVVSFMNEPNTVANMAEKALRDVLDKDIKTAGKTVGALATSIVVTNLLKSIIYAMRDDEEDETFREKYLSAVAGNLVSDVNLLNYIPYARDIWSIKEGYDVERADMAVVADAVNAITKLQKLSKEDVTRMTEEELEEWDKKVMDAQWKVAESLSPMAGIPLKNIRREVLAAINAVKVRELDKTRESTELSIRHAIEEATGQAERSDREKLYEAIVAGDKVYTERLKAGYKDDKAYHTAIRKVLREKDSRIWEAAIAWNASDLETYMKVARSIIEEGNFIQDDVVLAIRAEANSMVENDSSGSSAAKGYFTSENLGTAMAQKNTAMADTIRKDLIDTKVANGKTRSEAEEAVESTARSQLKELYELGEISGAVAQTMLVRYGGYDQQKASDKVSEWKYGKDNGTGWQDHLHPVQTVGG